MKPHGEFDARVFAYLDGDATPQQVVALRDALRSDPALRTRLAALIRLHRAQSAVLGRSPGAPFAAALAGLRRFADRAGRCLAHACILALVVVELDVAVPGVDMHAWVEPDAALLSPESSAADEFESAMPPQPADEDDSEPLPDVREADFLES